ncbi:O-antigen ligase family protein [Sporomusa acidovorans]|uniref:O-antigen ligase-related domain-containing protein n=1 Tax=Sporomusa acidovorans (strain ATCC 49682 / DSM 3132 / Mol) TaxID=1123286 RepID=A0ABZ3J0L8_SPOA4|nr:O-antigen ligase family protein [Sporomusa acidovorans]OZC22468.1 O-antigen ligase [Sporomusa acidovorans DSM 3132]SDE74141.1 O-Antigen ligase [Sporomusa acidovorans]
MHIAYSFNTQNQYRLDYLIEHCILAVAFFLPLSLNLTTLFLSAGTLLWIAKMILSRKLLLKHTPFDKIIGLLVILSAASIAGSPDKNFSFYNYYHLMGRYILTYYLVINNLSSLYQLRRLVWSVLASAVVVSAYGFYQYIHGVDISTFQWVDGEQFPELKVRVFSTLQNPNLLAGFLVVVMSLAAGLGLHSESTKERLLMAALIVVLGICLVLTYSRGAWLSIVAVIAICGHLYSRKMLWLFLLIPLAVFFCQDAVMERLLSIFNPTDTSSTLRLALWESTVAMICDKPFLGIGWGAYWLVYPEYDFFLNNPAARIVHAHNMYLHIAAEIGIPGLIVFLSIVYKHTKLAINILTWTKNKWVAGVMLGVVAAILGLAVNGFTDYIMFNIQMSMLFWFLNAIIVAVWNIDCRYK